MGLLDTIGHAVARFIERPVAGYRPFATAEPGLLRHIMEPGDVLLVDGNQQVSVAIRYLTQSTWSHAALYVGDALGPVTPDGPRRELIEVEVLEGCHASPLDRYRHFNLRICRPVGLTDADRRRVVDFMISHLGVKYDIRHIIDLIRYLIPTPPVPVRFRRRMIALGSGDPTRAICSSLIAQAFESVRYPILPEVETVKRGGAGSSGYSHQEIFHIRHHSLYTPRDFDLSPYFAVVKPTLETGFDYRTVTWAPEPEIPGLELPVEEEGRALTPSGPPATSAP